MLQQPKTSCFLLVEPSAVKLHCACMTPDFFIFGSVYLNLYIYGITRAIANFGRRSRTKEKIMY